MGIKEVKPGEVSQENILNKKNVRDLGSVGLDELVAKIQQKLVDKVEKVSSQEGANTALKQEGSAKPGQTPELKKAYFNQVGVEKNMNTAAARAARGNLQSTNDPRNLKLIVLPGIDRPADHAVVATFGERAHISAPFQHDVTDVMSRMYEEFEKKPKKAREYHDKMKERAEKREAKFGKKIPPSDQDPNQFCEEEYDRQKRNKKIAKMFSYLNKALGQPMDMTGAPPEESEEEEE